MARSEEGCVCLHACVCMSVYLRGLWKASSPELWSEVVFNFVFRITYFYPFWLLEIKISFSNFCLRDPWTLPQFSPFIRTRSQSAHPFQFFLKEVYTYTPFLQILIFCRGRHTVISVDVNLASYYSFHSVTCTELLLPPRLEEVSLVIPNWLSAYACILMNYSH